MDTGSGNRSFRNNSLHNSTNSSTNYLEDIKNYPIKVCRAVVVTTINQRKILSVNTGVYNMLKLNISRMFEILTSFEIIINNVWKYYFEWDVQKFPIISQILIQEHILILIIITLKIYH